jgi:hypothetical protein
MGAVLPLEKGPESDEFFLTFDRLHLSSYDRPDDPTQVVTPAVVPVDRRSAEVGLKTFDEIDATFMAVTGIDRTAFPDSVEATYQELRQSLPAVENINTFLASHQVAIAQLAISYCDALVNVDGDPDGAGTLFPGFNFDAPNTTAFAPGSRDAFINPLIDRIMGTGLGTQPARAGVYEELASYTATGDGRPDNLVDRLLNPPATDSQGNPLTPSNTRSIAKGVCAAMLGNAITLLQ